MVAKTVVGCGNVKRFVGVVKSRGCLRPLRYACVVWLGRREALGLAPGPAAAPGGPSCRPSRARLVGGSTQGSACRLHPGLRLLSPLRGCSGWGFFGLHRSPPYARRRIFGAVRFAPDAITDTALLPPAVLFDATDRAWPFAGSIGSRSRRSRRGFLPTGHARSLPWQSGLRQSAPVRH